MAKTASLRRQLGTRLEQDRMAKVLEILMAVLVPGAFLVLAAPLASGEPLRFQALVWVTNGLMLTFVWGGLWARGQGWEHLGLGLPARHVALRTVGRSLLAFVAASVGFVVGAIIAANVFGVPEGPDTSSYEYMSGNVPMLLGALAAAYVMSSLGEEAFYRGFLIHRLAELRNGRGRWAVAVVISALAFGVAHYSWGPSGMVQTGFMGLALGVSYLRLGRSLWVTVLAHAYMDTILFVQMYLGG